MLYFCTRFPKGTALAEAGLKKVWKILLKNFADWKKLFIFAVPFRKNGESRKARSLTDWKQQTTKTRKEQKSVCEEHTRSPRAIQRNKKKKKIYLQRRVWSWLRMNASDRPNTCKSRGSGSKACFACRRPAHGWVTRMQPACNRGITRRNPA